MITWNDVVFVVGIMIACYCSYKIGYTRAWTVTWSQYVVQLYRFQESIKELQRIQDTLKARVSEVDDRANRLTHELAQGKMAPTEEKGH